MSLARACMGHRGKSLPLTKKVQIISKWSGDKKNIAQIAREVCSSTNTVRKCIDNWETHNTFARNHGQGRKPALSQEACARALQLLTQEHKAAEDTGRTLFEEGLTNKVVFRSTIIKHTRAYAKQQGHPITCRPVTIMHARHGYFVVYCWLLTYA